MENNHCVHAAIFDMYVENILGRYSQWLSLDNVDLSYMYHWGHFISKPNLQHKRI